MRWTDSLPRGLENILNKHKSDGPQTHTDFHSRCVKVGRNNNGAGRMKSKRRCARKRFKDPWGPILTVYDIYQQALVPKSVLKLALCSYTISSFCCLIQVRLGLLAVMWIYKMLILCFHKYIFISAFVYVRMLWIFAYELFSDTLCFFSIEIL